MAARGKIMKLIMQSSHPARKLTRPSIKEARKKTKWHIVRGDTVQVIERKHPEFGKQGVVLKVLRQRDRVIVEGLNKGVHFVKPNPDIGRTKGSMVPRERSIHYSNVNLVDPTTGLPTRITKSYLSDGTKVRIAKKSGAIIPRPEILTKRNRPLRANVTDSDMKSDEDVWKVTYNVDSTIEEEMYGKISFKSHS